MATASIERRVKRLLAARDKELVKIRAERKRINHYDHQRRRLKWHQKQGTLWEIIRGPQPLPDYMRPPSEVARNAPQQPKELSPQQEAFARTYGGKVGVWAKAHRKRQQQNLED
jgi:hypothetical protein